MPLWKIAWRSIQRRALASGLTALSMCLGVMLVVAVLLIHGVIAESFRNNASLGYNLIVGAKGGRLQLVLNTVFYLSQPVENIPYSFYQEFLRAEERGDGRDGQWKDYVQRVVPVCLGDYYQQYRVVGTTPKMFDNYVYNADTGEKFEFAVGRNFRHFDAEHGFFEAVVGAKVARDAGLQVGDTIAATHGSSEGSVHGDRFHVVGILASSGTPNDRAVFVNMEGFYLLQGHAKPVEDDSNAVTATPTDHAPADHAPSTLHTTPLPLAQREVTALLISTRQILAPGLSNTINEGAVAQAVFPVGEIDSLFRQIVQPFQRRAAGTDRHDLRRVGHQHSGQHLQLDERPAARDRNHAFPGSQPLHGDGGRVAGGHHAVAGGRAARLAVGTRIDRTGEPSDRGGNRGHDRPVRSGPRRESACVSDG